MSKCIINKETDSVFSHLEISIYATQFLYFMIFYIRPEACAGTLNCFKESLKKNEKKSS